MRKYLPLIGIAVIAIVVGGGLALMDKQEDDTQRSSSSSNQETGQSDTGQASDQPATSTDEVEIENLAFLPSNISVKKGTTVTWTNKDRTEHTVTVDSGEGPKSGTLNRDDSYSFTFNQTGEFSYHCEFHPSMTGKITVTE